MAERMWFKSKSPRKVIIRSAVLLVGKAPTKQKRIKMLMTMPLAGENTTGLPDWLSDARDYVMKSGETVNARQVITFANVTMGDENLFHKTPVEAPRSRLSHMVILNQGSEEEPVTVLQFQIMAPFSTDLYRWTGQMAGEEFDSAYEIVEQEDEPEEEDASDPLEGDEEGDDEGEEEDELEGQARRAAEYARRRPALV